MKKTLTTTLAVMAALNFAFAQEKVPDFIDAKNLASVQKMSRHMRDSLITEIKKQGGVSKSNKVTVNGKDMSVKMAEPMTRFTKALSEIMIASLATDDPAVVAQNQEKYDAMEDQLHFEMDELSEKIEYEADRQEIIDKFNKEEYENAKEKHEARKEMKEDLRELKKDHKERMKDLKEDRKDDMKRKARDKKNV